MSTNFDELVTAIRSSQRILVVLGAGLSRPSGLPTFREDPDFWGTQPIENIATQTAFNADPIGVWRLYEIMRQKTISAQPNLGHIALAELAKAKPNLLTISQNIDGAQERVSLCAEPSDLPTDLCEKAGHDPSNLVKLHGSLLDVKCSSEECNYIGRNPGKDSVVTGLMHSGSHPSNVVIPPCPQCGRGWLRPGVVWFGETLPDDAMSRIDAWFDVGTVDLVLVVGTQRFPFVAEAVNEGGELAVFNIFREDELDDYDDAQWTVNGDASQTLPWVIGSALGIDFSRHKLAAQRLPVLGLMY